MTPEPFPTSSSQLLSNLPISVISINVLRLLPARSIGFVAMVSRRLRSCASDTTDYIARSFHIRRNVDESMGEILFSNHVQEVITNAKACDVYTFGLGVFGQLGHNCDDAEHIPRKIERTF